MATTNRNFVGRMGSPQAEVYLANPEVAAASAVLGGISTAGNWMPPCQTGTHSRAKKRWYG